MILTDKSFDILREELFNGALSQVQVDSLNYLVHTPNSNDATYNDDV